MAGVSLPKRASLPKSAASFRGLDRELFPSTKAVKPTIVAEDMLIAHITNACDASARLKVQTSEFDVPLIARLQAMLQRLTDTPPRNCKLRKALLPRQTPVQVPDITPALF
jgi:hypothetical protein